MAVTYSYKGILGNKYTEGKIVALNKDEAAFKLKEDKYYADITNNTLSQNGEVVFGRSSSGVKGFFGEVTMTVNNSAGKKELFAVSTGFVQSS
jgi:hypothetical protein